MVCAIPSQGQARTHIGDEIPAANYQIGNGPDISCEIEAEINAIPMFYPEWAEDRLTWTAYPYSAYYFRNAPTEGANFFSGKISDAGACIVNNIANFFFMATRFCVTVGNNLLITCFDDTLLKNSIGFVMQTVKSISPFYETGTGSGIEFIFFLALAGLGVSVCLLLLRAQVMKALSAVLVSVLCLSVLMIYTGHVESIIPPVISGLNNLTGISIMATSGLQDYVPEGEVTSPGTDIQVVDSDISDLSMLGLSMANLTNAIWFATVSGPWANGQFGTSDYSRLRMTPEEMERVNEALKRKGDSQRHKNLQSEYIDTNYLASSEDVKEPLLAAITAPDIDHGDHVITQSASGAGEQNAQRHITAAFWSMFPAAAFLVLMVLVGLPVFCSQIFLIGLLVILPFAFVAGIAGDRGRKVMLTFIQWTLQALTTKVVYGFYLGLVMMLVIITMRFAGSNTGLSGFLLFLVFGAAAYARKHFYDLVMSLISLTPAKTDMMDNPLKSFMKYSMIQGMLKGGRNRLNKGKGENKQNKKNNEGEPPQTPEEKRKQEEEALNRRETDRVYQMYSEDETRNDVTENRKQSSDPNNPNRQSKEKVDAEQGTNSEYDSAETIPTEEPAHSENNDLNQTEDDRVYQMFLEDETRDDVEEKVDTNQGANSSHGSEVLNSVNREDKSASKESEPDKSNTRQEQKPEQKHGADVNHIPAENDDDSLMERRRQLRENYYNDIEQPVRKRHSEDPPWSDKEY